MTFEASQFIPDTAKRLCFTAFADKTSIAEAGRERVLSKMSRKIAENALHKIVEDYVKTKGDYLGYSGQTLELDVYVLSPEELHQIIVNVLEHSNCMHYGRNNNEN